MAALALGAFALCATGRAALADCSRPGNAAEVFFITDREPVSDAQLFSGERGLTKTRDAIVSRGIIWNAAERKTLRSCASEKSFLSALKSGFSSQRGRQVLLYVHGYYTTFRQAVGDALTLQRTLRFPGPVIVYSWPSKVTSRLTYVNDEANAGWSAVHFRKLLATLETTFPGMPISFAAHSLGARFAADALDFIHHGRCVTCVGRTALFAPDVDTDTLRTGLAAAGRCNGRPLASSNVSAPVTLYVSNKDVALRQSQRIHGHQRAGQAASEMLLCKGVDTIDVSYYKSSDKLGHAYQSDTRIAGDVRDAFAGVSPSSPQRKLVKASREAGTYYELR
ncbi:MAG: alpha/beta hydrolase [Candidatus Eremiobacteraeota bacterium]|nr:alpha/beta hydrolase [Candidatus Eremiobacteraeota bacterium]